MKNVVLYLQLSLIMLFGVTCNTSTSSTNLSFTIHEKITYAIAKDVKSSPDKIVHSQTNRYWRFSSTKKEISSLQKIKSLERTDSLWSIKQVFNDHQTNNSSKFYIVHSTLEIDSVLIENPKKSKKSKLCFSIKGNSRHCVTEFSNDTNMSNYNIITHFDISFNDSLSDKVTPEMVPFIIQESFANNYFKTINKNIIGFK